MLNIEQVIDLTTYEGNSPPSVVDQLTIIHEAENGEIVQYFVDDDKLAGDKNSHAIGVYDEAQDTYTYVNYDELLWGEEKRRITTRKVDYLHVKAFPGVGAYAAYKLAYQVLSKVVIPVNNRQKLYPYPTQVVTITGNMMHFVFTNPEKVTYQCYRVVLRCEEYAEEHVTYEQELDCPLPQMNGEYAATVQGYISEGEEVSELSPEFAFTVNVPGQPTTPPTTTAGSDIFVSGLSFTQDNHLRATLTDGSHVDSGNAVPEELPAVSAGDNGKILGVVDGQWNKQDAPEELPNVDAEDNGKILGVVGGQWNKQNAPIIGIVFWRVRYYSANGSVLLHKEYVENGDSASWHYQDDKWATSAGGTEDPNAKVNIRDNRDLYYVEPTEGGAG